MTELQIVNESRAAVNDPPLTDIASDPMVVAELQPLIATQVSLIQGENAWVLARTDTIIAVTSISIPIHPGNTVTEAVSGAVGTLLWATAGEYLYIVRTPGYAAFTGGQALTFTKVVNNVTKTIGSLTGGVRTEMMPNQEWTLMQLPPVVRRLVSAETAREWARQIKRGALEESTLAQKIQRRKEAADRWDAGVAAAALGLNANILFDLTRWDYPTDELTDA